MAPFPSSPFYGLSAAHTAGDLSIPLFLSLLRRRRSDHPLRRGRCLCPDGPALALPDIRRGRSLNLQHVGSLAACGDPCLDLGQIPDHTPRRKVKAAGEFTTALQIIDRRVCQRHDLTQFSAADRPVKRQSIRRRHQMRQLRSRVQRLIPSWFGPVSSGGRTPWAMCLASAIRITYRRLGDHASQYLRFAYIRRLRSHHELPPTLHAGSLLPLASSVRLAHHAPRGSPDPQTRSLAAGLR